MSFSRSIIASVAALVFASALVPALAFAQVYTCGNAPTNNWYWGANNTTCAPGNLLVYVQVTNNYNNGYNVAPSAFTVAVSGLNASPATFPGSLSGTQVSVVGGYSVTALQLAGYTPSYSTGCNGTLTNGTQALCVITESNTTPYNNYPTPYNGYYYNTPLSCTPSYQTVNLGQTTTFVAQGGDYSQYNWTANGRSYLNVGPTLNLALQQTGTQNVTVTNGSNTATCTVNVVTSGAPVSIINPASYTGTFTTTGYTPNNYGGVYVTPTYVPSFPNTGFAPASSAAAASAVAVLIALALVALPYVRKAFTAVLS